MLHQNLEVFFDNLNNWAISEGADGMAYITFEKSNNKISGKGPIAKFFTESGISNLLKNVKSLKRTQFFLYAIRKMKQLNFLE